MQIIAHNLHFQGNMTVKHMEILLIPVVGSWDGSLEFQQHMPLIDDQTPIFRQRATPILIDLFENDESQTGQSHAGMRLSIIVKQQFAHAFLCV